MLVAFVFLVCWLPSVLLGEWGLVFPIASLFFLVPLLWRVG